MERGAIDTVVSVVCASHRYTRTYMQFPTRVLPSFVGDPSTCFDFFLHTVALEPSLETRRCVRVRHVYTVFYFIPPVIGSVFLKHLWDPKFQTKYIVNTITVHTL